MTSCNVAAVVQPYVIAVISTGSATWIRTLLDPVLGNQCPFSLYYVSVLLTAWLGGTYPALFSLALGTIAAFYYFIPPTTSIIVTDASALVNAAIYVFVNCIAISLFASVARQRANLENRLLENEQLGESLRRADERKDEFLALLAHELRNPLAPIRSSLLLLEKKRDCPETVEKVRSVCQRQIHQLVRLVDDLLDISRFLRGSLKLQIERIDLRDAISVAVEMSDDAFRNKSHRFDALLPDTPVWINGDLVRIAQLTENLLGNAAKYTPCSGRIVLHLEEDNGCAVLCISDNGIGFPPAESVRITEPFTQMDTSRTREHGGLGLGLAIVRHLVELHGGSLKPESRGPGSGSKFTVSFPLAQSPATLSVDPASEGKSNSYNSTAAVTAEEVQRSIPTESILIVEDNRDAAAALSELLELEGYSVTVAGDAVVALKKLEEEVPPVILMDIGLPGMDGYQLAKRIRSKWRTKPIRLIACTGWGSESDRIAARDAGFDYHLVKPVSFTELLDVLRDTNREGSHALEDCAAQHSAVSEL